MIPYGRQWISREDEQAVLDVLRSPWLTTGPTVGTFETRFAEAVGAEHAVAVSNGTAALHAAVYAAGIGPGDEVIVPPMTFAATANVVLFMGATPVFADVDPSTLLIDPEKVEQAVTSRTKAVIGVDYTGQPCDWVALRAVADRHNLLLIADACHAPGATLHGKPVGSLADLSTFSFHPVKHITTAEGGMITTDDHAMAEAMRLFRNHGITSDHRSREEKGTWRYEMTNLGYNYRLSDLQAALGLSQLGRLKEWVEKRRRIAERYDEAFAEMAGVEPLGHLPGADPAWHLYVVRIKKALTGVDRDTLFQRLRERGIGVNVHYIPVHLHPWYREHLGTGEGLCPVAEAAAEEILSLPMYPAMGIEEIETVIGEVRSALLREEVA